MPRAADPLIPASAIALLPSADLPLCRLDPPLIVFRSSDALAVAGLAPTATAPLAATSWRRFAKAGPSAVVALSGNGVKLTLVRQSANAQRRSK
jgi:hypothetical protein